MLGSQVSIGQAAVVCVFSMVVIFAVLFVISLMIDIPAAALKKQKAEPAAPAASAVPAAPAAPAVSAAQDGAELAVITAAIAAYLGKSTDEIVVREIRRVQNNESEWSRSGRTEALRGE